MLDKVVFTDLTVHNVFKPTPVWRNASEKVAARPQFCVVCAKQQNEVNQSVHQDGGRPITGIPEILETEAIIAEISMP
jgi:hypothetical protein